MKRDGPLETARPCGRADCPVGDRPLRGRDAGGDGGGCRGRLLRPALGRDRRGEAADAHARAGGGAARRGDGGRRAPDGPGGVGDGGRRCRGRSRPQQLDRARQDLVRRRPSALLRRPRGDRPPLRAEPGAAPAAPERRRAGGGHRPEPSRERARPPAGAADRGVHPHPDPVGHPDALRDLPALRLGHGRRAQTAEGARAADPRRDRPHPGHPDPALLVAHA